MLSATQSAHKTHIWWILSPQHLLLDFVGPAETLRMAKDMGANFELHYCGIQNQVSSSLGLAIVGLEDLPPLLNWPGSHLIMLAGHTNDCADLEHPEALAIIKWLKVLKRSGLKVELASICSGALMLAKAGWLSHKRCTTHFSLLEVLAELEPTAKVIGTQIFVEDGAVLTSAGITTGIDMALYLVEKLASRELSIQVARRLVLARRRGPDDPQLSAWHNYRQHLHPAIHKVQDAIIKDLAASWHLADLAKIACVSERHLSRLFIEHCGISFQKYIHTLRVAKAQEIQQQNPYIHQEQLALQAGFQSVRDLRRVFQQVTGQAFQHQMQKQSFN